jgi:hypothetical protein
MRWPLALALVTGCYRSASDRCAVTTGDPACVPGDAVADTMSDGTSGCVVPTANPVADTALTGVQGSYFTGVLADDFPAALLGIDNMSNVAVLQQRGQAFTGPFMVAIIQTAGEVLAAPRLAPTGLEIFLRIDFTSNNTHRIMLATREPNSDLWNAPVTVALANGMADRADAEPSPPTTTDPRRMVLSYGTSAIEEYVELGHNPRMWTLIRRIDNPMFGLADYAGEATLTADGQFLVVRAKSQVSQLNTAFMVARSADGGFNNIAVPLPGSGVTIPVNEPYLAPDCKHVFYSDDGAQVRMATYP